MKISTSNDLPSFIQTGKSISSGFELIKSIFIIIIMVGVIIFMWVVGVPWYFLIIFLFFGLLILVLNILRFRRITNADLTAAGSKNSNLNKQSFSGVNGEEIIAFVGGILATGLRFRTGAYVGTTEVKNPENAMIITNRRVMLVVVPIYGAGKVIDGADLGVAQYYLNRDDINEKLEDMLNKMPLKQIHDSNSKNRFIMLDDVIKVKFSSVFTSIKFFLRNGKSERFSVKDKEDRKLLKELFRGYL